MTIRCSLKNIVLALLMVGTLFTSITFADGLPGEYYITQRWRDLLSPHSPATNPAFLTEEQYTTLRGAFSPSLNNTFVLYEGGVTVPLGLYQSVGVSVLGVNSQKPIYPAVWNSTTNSIDVQEDKAFYDNHFHIMGSYAINPWNRLSLGANLIIYRIPNFGDPITGLAMDLGVSFRLANHPVLGQHLIGMSFQNVISPDFQFKEIQQQSINGKISWMAKLWDKRIDLGIDLDFKDFAASSENFYKATKKDDGTFDVRKGAKSLEFDFNSRIGFWLVRMINVYGLFGNDYIGAAGGMNVPTVFGGRDFQAAYQYMNMFGDNDIAYTHTVYFRGEFGPSREEIYAKKMARGDEVKPGELWTKALRAYSAGEYWRAMTIFGKLVTEFPDFFQNPLAVYYIGRCQEEMEIREVAMQNFFKTLSDYPASKAVPYANLGLLRLSYRDNSHDMVQEYHSQLSSATVPDSIKQAANYYYGASFMKQGKSGLSQAISYLSQVPPTHDDYPFAQQQLAIAFAQQGDIEKTKLHLENVIQFTPQAGNDSYQDREQKKAQKEIRNRSLALMGFLYFEQKQWQPAVAALNEISDDSYYYLDGQLGGAWAAFKSQKMWPSVKEKAENMISKSDHPMIQAEAAIMLAYYHMNNKDFAAAEKVLEPAEAKIRVYETPVVQENQEAYYTKRAELAELGMKANEFINTHETSYTIQQLSELEKKKDELEKEVRAFALNKDAQERMQFFGRNPKTIKQATNYLLGKIKDYISQEGASNNNSPDTGGMTKEELELMKELEKLNQ